MLLTIGIFFGAGAAIAAVALWVGFKLGREAEAFKHIRG